MIDNLFVQLSLMLGMPKDQLKYLFCMLITIPLGWLFIRLPKNKNLRHIFSMSVGLTLCAFCLGPFAFIHSFISSSVTYLLLFLLPHKKSPFYVFIWMMSYMSAR
jgi:lysophospholipid acyltransferase